MSDPPHQHCLFHEGAFLMAALGQYAVTVSAASILCGIIIAMSTDTRQKEILRLLCGIFLTMTVLSPFVKTTIPNIFEFPEEYLEQGRAFASSGEKDAAEAMSAFIKEETEAYILDKADALGVVLSAEVSMSDGIPCGAVLYGEASTYQKQQIINIVTEALGISKENLQWSGIS